MNWRSRLINQIEMYFKQYEDNDQTKGPLAGNPIEIATISKSVTSPTQIKDEMLPSVSFRFGNVKALDGTGRPTNINAERFTAVVLAIVNEKDGKDLVERCGDMYSAVEHIVATLKNYQMPGIFVDEARIGDCITGEGALGVARHTLTDKEFMIFRLNFIVEVDQ